MNRSLTIWLLAGALAASATWNWRLTHAGAAQDCASECLLDDDTLALTPEQERALDELCRGSCRSSQELEMRADARERELLAQLAAGELDAPRARALAQEIGALRGEALTTCVDGILAVRAVLTPEQLARLLAQCPPRASCTKTE